MSLSEPLWRRHATLIWKSASRHSSPDLATAESEGAKSDAKNKIKRSAETELGRIRKRSDQDIARLDGVWERFSKLKVGDLEGDEDLYREMETRYSDYFSPAMRRRSYPEAPPEL